METNQKLTRNQIEEIRNLAKENYSLIFDKLELSSDSGYNDEVRGSCPIHEGDNPTAFCYYTKTGYWKCYTNNCQQDNADIFGLVKLVKAKEDYEFNFFDSVKYVAGIIGYNISEEKQEFNLDDYLLLKTIGKRPRPKKPQSKNEFPIPISTIKNRKFESPYFESLGFSKETIKAFYIAECRDPSKMMNNRACAPIISEDGSMILGVTGRILLPKCPVCEYHHNNTSNCPTDDFRVKAHVKWLHYGFNVGSCLYNVDKAKEYITKYKTVIITEGTKEVWYLYQNGIYNAVSIFGINLTKEQIRILLRLGCKNLVLALDPDEKGKEASSRISEDVSHLFKCYNLSTFVEKTLKKSCDLDDNNSVDFESKISPYIKGIAECQKI